MDITPLSLDDNTADTSTGLILHESGDVYTLHDESCRSFEWLTSPASLGPILKQYLPPVNGGDTQENECVSNDINDGEHEGNRTKQSHHQGQFRRQALHVGCGTSLLGEWLADEFQFDWVANMDINPSALRWLEMHWQQRQEDLTKPIRRQQQQTFHCVDIARNVLSDIASGTMDLVMDKSTLDCGLCTGEMTIGLLREVYRCLRVDGGIYVVISFHHVDFIMPLLRDCPGAHWKVTTTTIRRQLENLVNPLAGMARKNPSNAKDDDSCVEAIIDTTTPLFETSISAESIKNRTTWSASGSFQPDDHYHDTVNVFVCQRFIDNDNELSLGGDKESTATSSCIYSLDHDVVSHHVQTTCDQWFQTHNPMLTPGRVLELQRRFEGQSKTLEQCYELLFNDEEKEHLSYLFFLEDWQAFRATHLELPSEYMTWETARDFLQEMQ